MPRTPVSQRIAGAAESKEGEAAASMFGIGRVEEYAARSRGKAVAGVGHTLAGHRESGTLHCFVVGSIASVC